MVFVPRYVQPPVISFDAIYEQSTPNSPIVFILSPGSDPASDLVKLAERSGFGGNRLRFLAMGQGQEKVTDFRTLPSPDEIIQSDIDSYYFYIFGTLLF